VGKQRLISQTQISGAGAFSDLKEQVNFMVSTSTSFVHLQPTPSNEWVIKHDLDKMPKVTILNAQGEVIYASVRYDSTNQVTIRFSEPVAGTAMLQYVRNYNYTHEQVVPSMEWVIEHNLHRIMEVTVIDVDGSIIYPYVRYDSPDKTTIKFNVPTVGSVYMQ
jgi:hypothetical protein